MSDTPQFHIDGMVSNSFCIDLMPFIKDEQEEVLFIESMLSALVDSFGDTFRVMIKSGFKEKVATVLTITFQEFKHLWDFGRKAAIFQKEMEDFLTIKRVYIRSVESWSNISDPTDTARRYELSVNNGIYDIKKTSKLSYVLKTIEDGVFKGTKYPIYSNDEVNF